MAADSDAISLWCVRLDPTDAELDEMRALLSPAERERAAQFTSSAIGMRFMARRAVLRLTLAGEIERPPESLAFTAGSGGKPRLEPSQDSLQFNMSSSGPLVLIGATRGRDVGVDVEEVRSRYPVGVVARIFGDRERAALAAVPCGVRASVFYRLWTAKEAYAKALGEGVHALRSCDVADAAVPSSGPAEVMSTDGSSTGWAVRSLALAPGFEAAVVGRGFGWGVRLRQLPA